MDDCALANLRSGRVSPGRNSPEKREVRKSKSMCAQSRHRFCGALRRAWIYREQAELRPAGDRSDKPVNETGVPRRRRKQFRSPSLGLSQLPGMTGRR